jgi:transposase-like protein
MFTPRKPKGKKSELMSTEKLQDVSEYCLVCTEMENWIENGFIIGDARHMCAGCRKGAGTPYRFDMMIGLILQLRGTGTVPKTPPPPGRRSVAYKRYGKAVQSLRAEGKNLRDIASTIGISVNTVRGILKRQTESEKE